MKKVAFIILIGISLSLFSQIISNPPEYPTKDFILNFLNNNIFFQYQNAIKERNTLYQKMKKIQDEELLPKIQKAKENNEDLFIWLRTNNINKKKISKTEFIYVNHESLQLFEKFCEMNKIIFKIETDIKSCHQGLNAWNFISSHSLQEVLARKDEQDRRNEEIQQSNYEAERRAERKNASYKIQFGGNRLIGNGGGFPMPHVEAKIMPTVIDPIVSEYVNSINFLRSNPMMRFLANLEQKENKNQ